MLLLPCVRMGNGHKPERVPAGDAALVVRCRDDAVWALDGTASSSAATRRLNTRWQTAFALVPAGGARAYPRGPMHAAPTSRSVCPCVQGQPQRPGGDGVQQAWAPGAAQWRACGGCDARGGGSRRGSRPSAIAGSGCVAAMLLPGWHAHASPHSSCRAVPAGHVSSTASPRARPLAQADADPSLLGQADVAHLASRLLRAEDCLAPPAEGGGAVGERAPAAHLGCGALLCASSRAAVRVAGAGCSTGPHAPHPLTRPMQFEWRVC